MASVSDDKTLRVWDLSWASSADTTPNCQLSATLSGYHSRTIYTVDWSPQGLLATGEGTGGGGRQLLLGWLSSCRNVYQWPCFLILMLDWLLLLLQEVFLGLVQPSLNSFHAGMCCIRGVAPAGDGSNAIKIFGQPDRLEAAAAAAAPSGPEGRQQPAAADVNQHTGLASPTQQQQQVEPLPSIPGAPWEQLCSVAAAHGADVNCVRWHPTDHSLLASASDDGVIKLWRLISPTE